MWLHNLVTLLFSFYNKILSLKRMSTSMPFLRNIFLFFNRLFYYLGFVPGLLLSIVAEVITNPITWIRTRRLGVRTRGFVKQGFEPVERVFKESFASGLDAGSAFCVYVDGEPVVDLWGGHADVEARVPWRKDTVSMFYSATKGVAALAIAMLVDRGLLKYDDPVSKVWPEFAQKGKEKITIRQLISHQAGLVNIREPYKLSMVRDQPEQLAELLASQKPCWKPGTRVGYHALTYGLYIDQIIRRVDPKHRDIAEFVRQEISEPLDLDFHVGLPPEIHYRVARQHRMRVGVFRFLTVMVPACVRYLCLFIRSLLRDHAYILLFIGNPLDYRNRAMNDPKFQQLKIASSHGHGTARSLAKLFGILANGGTHNGTKILSAELVRQLATPVCSAFDGVLYRNMIYGPGTCLSRPESPLYKWKSGYTFGHWGAGGQVAAADPHHRIGWSYVTNHANFLHGFIMDERSEALEKAMFECVYRSTHQTSLH